MGKTIIILATLDTKSAEVNFLKEIIETKKDHALIMDISMGIHRMNNLPIKPDITRERIMEAGGKNWGDLPENPLREEITPFMSRGAENIIIELIANKKAHGVIALGGTQGTTICSEIMRTLPYGFPKVIISTMASSDVSRFIDIKDIILFPSVSDILGLNPVLRKILSNAASAICGMANNDIQIEIGEKPLIGIVNVGVTTPGTSKAIEILMEEGLESIVFHGIGTGGRAMEHMIKDGIICAVFDYALIEVSNNIYNGLNDGGTERLTVSGKAGIPQVICPGAIEILGLWNKKGEPLPEKFRGRKEIRHSSLITTVRFNKDEMLEIAKEVVRRLDYTKKDAIFMIPKGAFSLYSKKDMAFYDPEANEVFSDYIREKLPKNFEVVDVDADLTDEKFVRESIVKLLGLIESYKK